MEANRRLAANVASTDADGGDGASHLKEESTTMVPSWSLCVCVSVSDPPASTAREEKLSEG